MCLDPFNFLHFRSTRSRWVRSALSNAILKPNNGREAPFKNNASELSAI